MKKIFSLFAAVLFAGSMMAQTTYTFTDVKTPAEAVADAISFIKEYERSPDSFAAPAGQFNSKPCITTKVDTVALRLALEDEWYNIPDILDPSTVSRLTCYSDNAVNRWLDKGILGSALTQNGRVTSKAWLIDFFCGKGMRIVKKNEWHLSVLKKGNIETVPIDF